MAPSGRILVHRPAKCRGENWSWKVPSLGACNSELDAVLLHAHLARTKRRRAPGRGDLGIFFAVRHGDGQMAPASPPLFSRQTSLSSREYEVEVMHASFYG